MNIWMTPWRTILRTLLSCVMLLVGLHESVLTGQGHMIDEEALSPPTTFFVALASRLTPQEETSGSTRGDSQSLDLGHRTSKPHEILDDVSIVSKQDTSSETALTSKDNLSPPCPRQSQVQQASNESNEGIQEVLDGDSSNGKD